MSTQLQVSRYVSVHWHNGRACVACARSGAGLATADGRLLELLHAFSEPTTTESALQRLASRPGDGLRECIEELIGAGILEPPCSTDEAHASDWDSTTLAFHVSSRRGPFQKVAHVVEQLDEPRTGRVLPLARGYPAGKRLSDVLTRRRSRRTWGSAPIPFAVYSQLFWAAARDRDPRTDRPRISRAYPSAGATYTLELYSILAPEAVESVPAGIYRYVPGHHQLQCISEQPQDCHPFIAAAAASARSALPPSTLVIASRFRGLSCQYTRLAYSLVLKEVGCVMQTFHLVAEDLDLSVCALGGGTPAESLARLTHASDLVEPVVGELIIGPRGPDDL